MSNIIPISSRTIGKAAVPTVNLRELHAKLESKQEFAHWVKLRLKEAMAVEGGDYTIDKFLKRSAGKRGASTVTDYYATLKTATHIAMLERNDKGYEFRDYFIEAENALRAMSAALPARPMGPVDLALLHLAAARREAETGKAFEMLVPHNVYGQLAANGRARLGLRRGAFVASRHRKDAAQEFMQRLERIDEMERQQLELDFEQGGAA